MFFSYLGEGEVLGPIRPIRRSPFLDRAAQISCPLAR